MQHDARSVANELIKRAKDAGESVTPLKIVKLTYFCHEQMLRLHHKPLLKQPVEAWKYGPAVPEVYRSLSHYGGQPITQAIEVECENYDEIETDLIDQIWEFHCPSIVGNDTWRWDTLAPSMELYGSKCGNPGLDY